MRSACTDGGRWTADDGRGGGMSFLAFSAKQKAKKSSCQPPSAVRRLPSAVCRPPSAVRRLPSAVCRPP
ncbi:MAG TPA: hypothetical protein ENJ53_09580 [Phaeodactylibacter sp.]|nr:hypothetical protein [Phaeodactylibacter sp.]